MKYKLLLLSFFSITVAIVVAVRVGTVRAQQSRFIVSDSQIATKISALQPFTITSKSVVTYPDGHRKPGDTQTWSSDKDRQAHRITIRNSKSGVLDIDEIDIRSGNTRTLLNTVTRSKTTTQYDPGFVSQVWANSIDPGSNCLNLYRGTVASSEHVEIDGFEGDNGVRLIRMKSFTAPSVTTLSWRAPDFGCSPVKTVYNWKGEGGNTTMEIVSASRGYVDESLFSIPQDYEEVMPSEYYDRQANATTGGKFARANQTAQFLKDMQSLKVRFKVADDYWLSHKP